MCHANRVLFHCILITSVFMLCVPDGLRAGQNDSLGTVVLKAIGQTADYASGVLLDEQGRSKCDYNLLEGKWFAYETPWHTGQIINALVEAYKVTHNPAYLASAQKAGDWWCSLLITDHPVLKGMVRAIHGDGLDYIVFATVTDGTPGLFNLYKTTQKKIYADVPSSAGAWMLEHMYEPEHAVFYDVVDPASGEVMKRRSPFWPAKKEQRLYDVARPNNEGSLFKDMYEYTGESRYRDVFIRLCESLVEKQDSSGVWMDFVPNNKEERSFHPRFPLWYAESLLDGYDLTGDRKYLLAAKRTLLTFQRAQRSDGTIYYVNYLDGRYNENSITGSATAFAGLLWMRLVGYGVGEEFMPNIERSFQWILSNRFSVDHPDPNLRGAVIDLRTRRKGGRIWLTQRDVGTPFAIRFLAAYYSYSRSINR